MNMKKSLRKLTSRSEFYITLVFLFLCLLIEVRSHQFFTPNNIVDILSALVVPGIFAIGEFMVIVSGGFDISFRRWPPSPAMPPPRCCWTWAGKAASGCPS